MSAQLEELLAITGPLDGDDAAYRLAAAEAALAAASARIAQLRKSVTAEMSALYGERAVKHFADAGKPHGSLQMSLPGNPLLATKAEKSVTWDQGKLFDAASKFPAARFRAIATIKITIPETNYAKLTSDERALIDGAREVTVKPVTVSAITPKAPKITAGTPEVQAAVASMMAPVVDAVAGIWQREE